MKSLTLSRQVDQMPDNLHPTKSTYHRKVKIRSQIPANHRVHEKSKCGDVGMESRLSDVLIWHISFETAGLNSEQSQLYALWSKYFFNHPSSHRSVDKNKAAVRTAALLEYLCMIYSLKKQTIPPYLNSYWPLMQFSLCLKQAVLAPASLKRSPSWWEHSILIGYLPK